MRPGSIRSLQLLFHSWSSDSNWTPPPPILLLLSVAIAMSTAPAAAGLSRVTGSLVTGRPPENTFTYSVAALHLFLGVCVPNPQLTHERVVAEADAGRIQCQ